MIWLAARLKERARHVGHLPQCMRCIESRKRMSKSFCASRNFTICARFMVLTSEADTTTNRSDKSSENRSALLLRSPFRQARDRFRDVLPKIPEPKNPPRENVVSLRFSDMEKEKLDKACEMYATYWNKKHVGHAELIRAAVEMMYDVMQQSGRQESK